MVYISYDWKTVWIWISGKIWMKLDYKYVTIDAENLYIPKGGFEELYAYGDK